jgi:hypothetical protein
MIASMRRLASASSGMACHGPRPEWGRDLSVAVGRFVTTAQIVPGDTAELLDGGASVAREAVL